MAEEKNEKTVSEGIALQFGLSQLTIQLVTSLASTYAAFFMTDILGISATSMGLVITIGGLIDTWGIFVLGGIVNNTHLKWGKYRSWMFIAPPLVIVGYVLFFLPWIRWGVGEAIVTIMLVILYALQMSAGNLLTISTNGLAATVGQTFEGRTKIIGRMMQVSSAARFIGGYVFLPFVAFVGGGDDAKGYALYFLLFGIFVLLAYLNLARV